MKHILIGAVVLLVIADFVFWGGPTQLAEHLQDTFGGNPATGTVQAAGSLGGMIGNTTQAAGNAFGTGLGK